MFKNITVKSKLYTAFSLIILLMVITLIIFINSLNNVLKKQENLLNSSTNRVLDMKQVNIDALALGLEIRALYSSDTDYHDFDLLINNIDNSIDILRRSIDRLAEGLNRDTYIDEVDFTYIQNEVDEYYNHIEEYIFMINSVREFVEKNEFDRATVSAFELGEEINNRFIKELDDILIYITEENISGLASVESLVQNYKKVGIIWSGLSTVVCILMAVFIVRDITYSLKCIQERVLSISNGNLDVSIRSNTKDEFGKVSHMIGDIVDVFKLLFVKIKQTTNDMELGNIDSRIDEDLFKGDYKNVANAINKAIDLLINDTNETIDVIKEYANGNFDATIKRFPGKKANLHETVDLLKNNLEKISTEINYLSRDAILGNLSKRADVNLYEGGWKKVFTSLNTLMDQITEPIKEVTDVLKSLAQGDLNINVKGNYEGDHALLKTSINKTISILSSYIKEIDYILYTISNKNLQVEIERDYIGDFEKVKISINNILLNLNTTMKEIDTSSDRIISGIDNIHNVSSSLAEGVRQQSGAVRELKSNVQDILEKIQLNSDNVFKVESLASVSKNSSDLGTKAMKKMLSSMDEINKSSEDISKIIKVINDIAFQTNLLALNASVEAARAGVYGKGFAVVAEEVRNLAVKSKDAAEKTNLIIENTVEKTKTGFEIANKTSEVFREIVEQISEMTILIDNVSNSSAQQAESIDKINLSIERISNVTFNNSALSLETATASIDLTFQTKSFKNLVKQFNLKE